MATNQKIKIPDVKELSGLLIQKVAPKVLKFFVDSYSNEGYWSNGRFVRWADRKKDTGKKLLYDTGNMKKSFHLTYNSKSEFTISNTAEYSKYHNGGTPKMPARPILYDDNKINELIDTTVKAELDKIFKNILK